MRIINNLCRISNIVTSGIPRKYYALSNLDKKMLKHLNYRDGFYVEMGANDGVTQSNTLYLEQRLHWAGLLIKPIKHNFEKLKKIEAVEIALKNLHASVFLI